MAVSEFTDAALYDADGGFYSVAGRPGRRGDFITAPELGPLFGVVLARALKHWQAVAPANAAGRRADATGDDGTAASAGRSGNPLGIRSAVDGPGASTAAPSRLAESPFEGRFDVVELGAGTASLARSAVAASDNAAAGAGATEPGADSAAGADAAGGLCWWAVETSARLRAEHPDDDPRIRSVATLDEVQASPQVVLANELLDNVAFRVVERAEAGWRELLVDVDAGGRFAERLGQVVEPPTVGSAEAQQAVDSAAPGVRLPVHDAAVELLRELRRRWPRALIVVFDYAAGTAELCERSPHWLRSYSAHDRHDDWLSSPGSRDITCDLAVEQIAAALPEPVISSQADWLRAHGIDELAAEARRVWEQRAQVGDLAGMRARSTLSEAAALLDPAGLGGFSVFEWAPEGP